MHLTAVAAASIMLARLAGACVTAHVYLNNCVFGGDVLSAQVYDSESCLLRMLSLNVLDNRRLLIGGILF